MNFCLFGTRVHTQGNKSRLDSNKGISELWKIAQNMVKMWGENKENPCWICVQPFSRVCNRKPENKVPDP